MRKIKPHKLGIYKIQSQIKSERIYIGSTSNIEVRKRCHYLTLSKNTHHCIKLQRHYNKYGKDDLIFSIIEECIPSLLQEREEFYIKTCHPYFNCNPIATNNRGMFVSLETRKKQSNAKKGKRVSPATEFKKGVKNRLGSKHTEESRKEMSEKKKKFFENHPEVRQYLSELYKGIPKSAEFVEKMAQSKRGKKLSQKTKDKISKAHKGVKELHPRRGFVLNAETRMKISIVKTGTKASLETRKKQSESARKAWMQRKLNVNLIHRI